MRGPNTLLGGRFEYIFYFFLLGRGGKGESEAPVGGGDRFLLKIPGEGGGKAGRGRAAGRVSAANWGIFWGGGG